MANWGRLRVLDGASEGSSFPLDRPVLTFGRSVVNDIRISDPTISRQQAEIRCGEDGVLLSCVSDRNPLWVNGEPVREPRRLLPGDKIQCGLVHLVFEDRGEEPPPASPPAAGEKGAAPPGSTPAVRCPRCGSREHPGARYCGTCGMPLLRTDDGSGEVPKVTLPPVPASPTRPDLSELEEGPTALVGGGAGLDIESLLRQAAAGDPDLVPPGPEPASEGKGRRKGKGKGKGKPEGKPEGGKAGAAEGDGKGDGRAKEPAKEAAKEAARKEGQGTGEAASAPKVPATPPPAPAPGGKPGKGPGHSHTETMARQQESDNVTVASDSGAYATAGVSASSTVAAEAAAPAAVEAAPGAILAGRYELRRSLGSSRVAHVFAAWDRRDQKEVAVKVLLPALRAQRDARDQFLNAARCFVSTRHDGLVAVDGVHEDGEMVFSTMELLAGVSLHDQVRARPSSAGGYPAAEVRIVGTALCAALEALHDRSAHGNVRPENVWITSQGVVKLMDAGLLAPPGKAPVWPASTDLSPALYAPPEVLRGTAPDSRSDQYSTAAVLFQMLVGEVPVGRIPPVRALRRDIPEGLARAVDKALSPRPEDRFASVADMGQALEGKVRIPGLRTPGTRRRAAAAALLGIGILVLGAALQEPLGDWWRKSTVNASLVDQVAEARQAADAARGNLLEFGEFASLAVFEQAVVGMDRGDEARARWRLAEALEEYEKARALLVRQIDEADQKRSDHEVYEGARVALASAENDRLFAQRALEDVVAKAEREAARFPQEPPPGAGGEERLHHRDSRDGTQGAVVLARGAYARWRAKCLPEEGGADPKERASLLRSREAADRALLLRGRGRFREAADEYGTALLHYWKALAEGQRTALEALLGPVPGGGIQGLDDARGTMDRAVQMELTLKRPKEVAEAYMEAERAFRDLLPPALEAATVALVADYAEHRCADCGGNGTCPGCSGTKRGKGPCSHCRGTGSVDVTCPACKGGREEPCTACHERGSRIGDCPECKARGRKPCPTCAGRTLSCLFCNGTGEQVCLRCNGTGRPAAGGERAPCPDCAGSGKRPCSECRGSKTRPCGTCRDAATGKALGDILCAACEGAGKRNIPCPDCHGTARAPCSACRGKGTVPAGCPDCPGSSGQVPVVCDRCGGAGRCPSCLGRGRRE